MPRSRLCRKPLSSFTKKACRRQAAAKQIKLSTILRRAIELHPNFGLALNELGVQYLRKGELDKLRTALVKGASDLSRRAGAAAELWHRAVTAEEVCGS